MKKIAIGCLAAIGVFAIVLTIIGVMTTLFDSNGTTDTTTNPTQTLAGTTTLSTTTTPPTPTTTPTSVHEELSTSEIINRISPAVAHIIGDYSEGTGIVVDEKGYILTNNHVVEEEYYVIVLLPDREQVIAEIVYRDQYLDLAIIKCLGTSYPYVSLGSIEEPSLGDDVIVIGYPLGSLLGESASMSKGIISAFRTIEGVEYIQTDAPANPGNSGGPLINTYGDDLPP